MLIVNMMTFFQFAYLFRVCFRVVQIFEQFIAGKINPVIGEGGHKAILYLQHLKVMLNELDKEKLGLLRDA